MTLSTPTPWQDDYDRYDEPEPDVTHAPTITVYDQVEQGSDEWMDLRRGMLTASVIGQLIAVCPPDAQSVACPACHAAEGEPCLSMARKTDPTPIKGLHPQRTAMAAEMPPVYKPATGEAVRAITARLVAERITGWTDPVFVSADMLRGKMDEPLARDLYSKTYAPVVEVGFIVADFGSFRIGYSPDGLVGSDGLIECKSRRAKKHLLTIVDDQVPTENMCQIQTGLLVTGRRWCDYLSYCGGMPMWRKRVYPDFRWQGAIIEAARMFEMNAARMVSTYRAAVEGLPMTERIEHFPEIEF